MSGRGGRRRYQGNRQGAGDAMAVDQNSNPKVPFVELRNWEAGTMADVINFLERKSRIRLQNARQTGGVISAQVSANETRELEKWNGARFAGGKLNIRIVYKPAQPSAGTSATIQILESFLQSRYNQGARLLNLSGMMSDPTLRQHGLLESPGTALKMFKALMRVASERLPEVDSLSLESNFLTDAELAEYVAETYPKLLNLSMANNQIAGVAAFVRLRNKFPMLRELVLAGNPLQQNPAFQSQAGELVAMFPRLLILDGITVRSEADLPKNSLPAPIKPTFFEDEGVASMTPMFLTNFFSLWDTNRAGLISLYDEASFFSLCFDTAAPHLPTSKPTPQSYIQMSRNLKKNHGVQARHHRIYFGPSQVGPAFDRVPGSKHDLTNARAFAIDSWKITDVRSPGDTAVMMVVHGEFEETTNTKIPNNVNSRVMRSFDRTLVVLPGPNMSYIVASDILNIRLHSALPVSGPEQSDQQPQINSTGSTPTPGTMGFNSIPPQTGSIQGTPQAQAVPAAIPSMPQAQPLQPLNAPMSAPMNAPTSNAGTPPQANAILQEFMRQTGLVAEYAEMCLKQANFDPNVAMQLFQQSRTQLPPNAFMS